MKLFVNNTFLFRGAIRRAGSVLTVMEPDLKAEMDLGQHKKHKGVYLSGLLNHCSPADDETAKFMGAKDVVEPVIEPPEGSKEEYVKEVIEANDPRFKTWTEMESLGVAYDKRWGADKLEMELLKAKKLKGV